MTSESCENCPDHSGQAERIKSAFGKINLLVWMIGIQITVTMAVGVALYNGIQTVQLAQSINASRMAGLEEKIRGVENNYQRICDRIDGLERLR